MFLGTFPADARAIAHELTAEWKTPDVWVACSGNFTFERTFEGRFKLHSNDVSLYSTALGSWLGEQPLQVSVQPEQEHDWGWLFPYLDTPIATVSTLLLALPMLQGFGHTNRYYERMRGAYRAQWPRLHADTIARLERVTLRLEDFHCGDARSFVDSVPKRGAVVSFPSDAGGYEALESVFSWQPPEHEPMDLEAVHDLLARMRQKRHWLYGVNHQLDGQEEQLRGVVQTSSRSQPLWVYANAGETRTARPRQRLEPVAAARLMPGDEIGDRITLAPLSPGQFNALRSQYLDPRIAPGTAPRVALGVVVDSRIVGCAALEMFQGREDAYLAADFAVAPTGYARLSKLIVAAALSAEAQALCQRLMSRVVRGLYTVAFSDHASSMKYRGLLELTTREELTSGQHRYKLSYSAPMGQWTLDEALSTWREKHGRRG